MSYVDRITYVQNSYGFNIEGQAKDDSGNILDLTEYTTVKFRMRRAGSATKVDATVTVTDAVNGKWRYTFASNDLNIVGIYEAQLVCQKTGKEVTLKGLTIIVAEQIPVKV